MLLALLINVSGCLSMSAGSKGYCLIASPINPTEADIEVISDDLVDDLYKRIIDDSKLTTDDNIAVMINSLGATPLEELYIISKRVNENLTNSKIKNIKTYVGRYATSMEMAGMSITTLKLNDNLKKYLLAESKCPFWNN